MNDIDYILGWWFVIGYLMALVIKSPDTVKQAWLQIILCGPIGWIVFMVASIRYFYKYLRYIAFEK